MITYEGYFEILKTRGISQNEAIRKGIVDNRLYHALLHNKSITINSLNKICNKLYCEPNDILRYKRDEETNKEDIK